MFEMESIYIICSTKIQLSAKTAVSKNWTEVVFKYLCNRSYHCWQTDIHQKCL